MNNDPRRYDNDDLYEEDTGYEDGYDTDDYDYIIDDEDEDENALWDDEEASADTDDDSDEPPRKKRRKRKETVYADVDTDEAETEEYETVRRRLAKEQRLIDELQSICSHSQHVPATARDKFIRTINSAVAYIKGDEANYTEE